MALVTVWSLLSKESYQVHEEARCTYSVFEKDGKRYLQLDTYGSDSRRFPEKVSQSVQLDERAAQNLKLLIESTFRPQK